MMEGRRRGFFVSGGTLPADSASYIERSTDRLLLDSLLAGRFCYVLNPRQLGKSSLSVHTMGELKAKGVRTAFVDLTRIGGKNVTPEQWYSGIALEIGRELGKRKDAVIYWKEHDGTSFVQRLFGMIRDVALQDESNLVIFIDEIDATRSLPFDPDEFFAAIRECYNRRVSDPALERLTFCLLGVAVPSDLVRSRAMTPFNIGERMTLEDFTLPELSAFAPELGPKGQEVVDRVHYWTGGHPFLSQSLCRTIVGLDKIDGRKTVDEVVRSELFDFKARDSNINLADVANIALHYGDTEPDPEDFRAHLLSVYERVLTGKEVFDDESNRAVVLLKLSGIVRSDGRKLHIRNRIYERVFDKKWIEEHMPEQELRRQLQSYRRGAWRTALVGGSILAVVGAVGAFGWYSRIQAVKAEERLNYELYVADMNSLRHFYDSGDTGRIETILSRHRNSPYRGFEWGYWLGRYHDSPEEYALDYKAPGKRVEGHISADGKEICLVDGLTQTVFIIERHTKNILATGRVPIPFAVYALKSRWVSIDNGDPYALKVIDIKSNKQIASLGDATKQIYWYVAMEHSDFIATGEMKRGGSVCDTINIWNVETGKKVFGFPNPWKSSSPFVINGRDPFQFSQDGRYIMFERGPHGLIPGDPDRATKGEAYVKDLVTGKVVDRFAVNNFDGPMTTGFQKRWLFQGSRGRSWIRDIQEHRTTEFRPNTLDDWQILGATLTGDALIVLLDGGRCLVRDLTGKESDTVRENVFSIAPGTKNREYIASSNSVRIYDAASQASSSVIAHGRRVTRYAPGIINVFSSGNPAITRIDERTFKPLATIPAVGDGGHYTYSGRWYLKLALNGDASLIPSEKGIPTANLPFRPTIWSVGRASTSFALWRRDGNLLAVYSPTQKKILWERPKLSGVTSLWVSPDETKIFAAIGHRDMIVLDMTNGKELGNLGAHNFGPINLTFSGDGKRVFTCGADGVTAMWDAATLKKLAEYKGNDQDAVTSADISPDHKRVVTTRRSGSWQLWDAARGVQLLDVRASAAALTSALFLPDGHTLMTAGEDHQVRLWRSVDSDPTTYIPIDPSYLKGLRR